MIRWLWNLYIKSVIRPTFNPCPSDPTLELQGTYYRCKARVGGGKWHYIPRDLYWSLLKDQQRFNVGKFNELLHGLKKGFSHPKAPDGYLP